MIEEGNDRNDKFPICFKGLDTYNEGVVERSVDVSNTKDELVGSNSLRTVKSDLLLSLTLSLNS